MFVFTAQAFLSQWCMEDEESHPALEVLKRLLKTSDLLSPTVCTFICTMVWCIISLYSVVYI